MERISLYLYGPDEWLKPALEERARHNNRSLSAETVVLIKKALAEEEKEAYIAYQMELAREDQ